MRIRKQLHLPPPPSLVAPPPPPPPSLDLPTPSSLPPFLHPHGDLNLSTPSHLLHPPPKHVKKQIPLGIKEDEPQDEESQAGAKEERFSMSNGRNSSAKACSHGILSSSSSSSSYQENEKTDDVTPKTTEKYVVVVVEKTEDNEVQTSTTENKKKNKRVRINGAMLLEGSRCSRVNGRGWRCSQQTLGGYSLCEHHLGKGRLRSVTNGPKRKKESLSSYSIPEDEDGEESEDSLSRTKKRKKIGMVKARSMSSLLSVAEHASNTITT